MTASSSRSVVPAEKFPELLEEDFELVKKLPNCGTAVIYQAVSTRGRLRGRNIALKKVIRTETTVPSTSLYQALCHPNIVALYSIASSESSFFDYHVLELCSEGSLLALLHSRNPPTLIEAELRNVTKGIAGALAYLKDERIIHGSISLSHILLGQGFKPKLCGFKNSARLRPNQDCLTRASKFTTHLAPEMSENPPRCDFATDVWALGCVLRTCIGGTTDDDLSMNGQNFSRAFPGYQPELRHLVMSMLLPQSAERLKAENISRHRYLLETSGSVPHTLLGARRENNIIDKRMLDNVEPFGRQSSQGLLPGSQKRQEETRTCSDKFTLTTHSTSNPKKRHVLKDIGNVPLPRFLRSRPTWDSRKSISSESAMSDHTAISERQDLPWKLINDHETDANSLENTLRPGGSMADVPSLLHRVPVPNIPIGTTRPLPVDTRSLSPKVHKLAMGTITILNSRSLLVDFRQNLRRLGLKGDQVMVISGQGTSIAIFHAPHLSVPTCLLEPIHQYNLDSLPSAYWEQYNDAANFVDRLRRKIPFIVMYKSGAKCVMMSNYPLADIEIILYGDDYSAAGARIRSARSAPEQTPVMRIQYSRRRHFLELAQRLIADRGTEWKKDCKPCLGPSDISGLLLGDEINELGKKGLTLVLDLLQACHHLEVSDPVDLKSTTTLKATIKNCDSLSSKLGQMHSTQAPPTSHADDILEETRHLPSVGWCKRYPILGSSNSFKYMMLLFDGTSLLVDVAAKSVLLSLPTGNQITCPLSQPKLTERHPQVAKYTRLIADFLSLYDCRES